MSNWETTKLYYRQCKVYKDGGLFGKQKRNGYILDSPLIFKLNNKVTFILPTGYVWDGPSYPKWLEKIVGERNAEALLAASAMHDSMDKMPYITNNGDMFRTKSINIKRGAKLYRRMIRLWPNKEDKPSKIQRTIQYIGLTTLQRVYTVISSKSPWKLYK